MKLKYLTLSFIFLFTNIFIQDTKTDLICNGKWHIKSAVIDGNKVPLPPGKSMWMTFSKDGKHIVNAGDVLGDEEGKWIFSKNKDSIIFTTSAGEKKFMGLKTLTKENLNLSFKEQNNEITMFLEKN